MTHETAEIVVYMDIGRKGSKMQLLEDYIELNVGSFRRGTITKKEAVNRCIGFMECLYYQNKIHFDETKTIKKYIERKVSEAV